MTKNTPTLLTDDDQELVALCKALGNETRLMIVRILLARDSCVCGEIVDELPNAQSTVSQHLKVLKQAGIIQGEIQGPSVCYCINPKTIDRIKTLINSF